MSMVNAIWDVSKWRQKVCKCVAHRAFVNARTLQTGSSCSPATQMNDEAPHSPLKKLPSSERHPYPALPAGETLQSPGTCRLVNRGGVATSGRPNAAYANALGAPSKRMTG